MQPVYRNARRGMTLMEIMVATTLMATVMASVAVLLRGTFAAWQAHEIDLTRVESAQATVRHLVRQIRQSQGVTAVSGLGVTSGTVSLLMPNTETHVWSHVPGTSQVLYGVGSATDLLAENITELSFECFEADGITPTVIPVDIQMVRCIAKVDLPGNAVGSRTISCRAWIRSW